MNDHRIEDDLEVVHVRVPAKVNLGLVVGPLRSDGFHGLRTVFQAVSLFDELWFSSLPNGEIRLSVSGEGADQLGSADENLAVRAAKLIRERHGSPQLGVAIEIKKHIPVAGGMAGGSADAAGALLGCSVLWDLDTDPAQLQLLAGELGSDVPFALLGGTALGSGRGTELVPMLTRGRYHWVFALAEHGLSTPQVYQTFDAMPHRGSRKLSIALQSALTHGDAEEVGRHLSNDLLPAALKLYPQLADTLSAGSKIDGVLGAVLAGSGPTCAFLCSSPAQAADVANELRFVDGVRDVRTASGPVSGAMLLS
jgi:4-diphosphocytidyl-2-C-methyl-D-erythritol kinase